MKRIALLILIAVVAISSAETQNLKRTLNKSADGFKWYLIEQEGHQGAETKKGKTIIPIDKYYNYIFYEGGGFFKVIKEENGIDYKGIYKSDGTEIISIDRHYQYIETEGRYANGIKNEYYHNDNDYFFVVRHDYKDGAGLCNRKGEIVIPIDKKNSQLSVTENGMVFAGYWGENDEATRFVYDTLGRVIIPFDRGYCFVSWYHSLCFEIHKEFGEERKIGLCDIYGNEFLAPEINYEFEKSVKMDGNCFYYINDDNIARYLGVMLDKSGHGIPDPYHPKGSFYVSNQVSQNTNNTYQPSVQYNTTTPSYNNNTQQPSQHNNNNTTVREKCKFCMGSGRCQGLNSPGGTRTIKLHCNGSGRCSTCGGKGLMSDGFGHQTKCSDCSYTGKCRFCKGTGKCDRCGGTGYR